MTEARERRPPKGTAPTSTATADTPKGTTDRRLDRAAELVSVSTCHLWRGELRRLARLCGGHARVAEILGSVRDRWGRLYVAAARVVADHPSDDWRVTVAADEPEVVGHLSGIDPRDLTSWASWRDPEPLAVTLAHYVGIIAETQRWRALAPVAAQVLEDLEHGRRPSLETLEQLALEARRGIAA